MEEELNLSSVNQNDSSSQEPEAKEEQESQNELGLGESSKLSNSDIEYDLKRRMSTTIAHALFLNPESPEYRNMFEADINKLRKNDEAQNFVSKRLKLESVDQVINMIKVSILKPLKKK